MLLDVFFLVFKLKFHLDVFCLFCFSKIEGLDVRDFTSSWRDGLAFNALIHSIRPELVDLHRISRMDVRERLEHAFKIAEEQLGIPRLIDAEGMC